MTLLNFHLRDLRNVLLLLLLIPAIARSQASFRAKGNMPEQIPSGISLSYSWWNLLHYSISITPNYVKKYISGTNDVEIAVLKSGRTLKLDLQNPMRITGVRWNKVPIAFKKSNGSYFITFPRILLAGEKQTFTVSFEGNPRVASDPPVDNGWIWSADEKGRPWMSIACEGSGASIWLPCKDVLYDEPENGVILNITVPDSLTAVANGRLQQVKKYQNGTRIFTWVVSSPINNYSIVPYIGKYVSWRNKYDGLQGQLDCEFWTLDYNAEKGKKHFQQADTMLRAFEFWLGPYPFYRDGYKLVEAPLPGMEHQSAIAYGNGFVNGYRGKNFLSGTPWGLKWDFMLVHESGHEWFGNSITAVNDDHTWLHEGFTKYLETLYTAFVFGRQAGDDYAIGTWKRIKNDRPIIGSNTSDKYYKASAMLHCLRQVLGDTAFRGWLRRLNSAYYHRSANTQNVLQHLNQYSGRHFDHIFEQYLQTTKIPVLEYFFDKRKLYYQWSNSIPGFDMPVKVYISGNAVTLINPTAHWKTLALPFNQGDSLAVDRNFLIKVRKINRANISLLTD